MKFSVGYQLPEEGEEPFTDIVEDFKEYIEEVYFPWLDIPTCRAPLISRRGHVEWKGQERLEEDLKNIRRMNIKLDLLLNANCYGRYSVSQHLANLVCSVVEHLQGIVGLDAVTTTSLLIAHIVKQNFKKIDVRASVNMRIGTIKGMKYVSDLFDSFHIQREYNRDFNRIKELKTWADRTGKRVYLLANSGCLNFCSGQIFHDNLVAHEIEIDEIIKIPEWNPHICWDSYKSKNNWGSFFQNSWIRPEDIHHYEKYFEVLKLATRMHSNPRIVIQAYAEAKYRGNLLDILEPGYGPIFFPYVIDNTKFPDDWFEQTAKCDKKCHECDYCDLVQRQVLVNTAKTKQLPR